MADKRAYKSDHHRNDTTIGAESIFTGVMTSNGNIRVDGIFEGDIVTSRHIQISTNGRVRASVATAECTIYGLITGKIIATQYVVIEATARAWCEIKSPTLRVEPGALFKGSSNGTENEDVT